jgi:ribosome-binding protein aMBF1 (putative translation factor)
VETSQSSELSEIDASIGDTSYDRPVTRELADIVARNIRLERGRRRWKQEQLAEMLGWGTGVIVALETGARRVSMDEGADPEDLKGLGL